MVDSQQAVSMSVLCRLIVTVVQVDLDSQSG